MKYFKSTSTLYLNYYSFGFVSYYIYPYRSNLNFMVFFILEDYLYYLNIENSYKEFQFFFVKQIKYKGQRYKNKQIILN